MEKIEDKENLDFENLLYFQQLFKDLIGFHVIVENSNSQKEGEVRICFQGEKDLNYLLERLA